MPPIAAHGIRIDLPRGWEGQLYVRSTDPALADDPALTATPSVAWPILHAGNVALPPGRGDYGSGAVEGMGSGGIFLALLESEPASATTAMFDHPAPWPLTADSFGPEQLQRAVPGGAGCQRFFVEAGRPFCLYAAIGSHTARHVLVRELNRVLATVRIDPR